MRSASTKLGLLSTTTAAIVWLVLPGTANADTQTNVTFDALSAGDELDGRLYLPEPMPANPPAIIMMHGCSGMWSGSDPATGVAQRHIEKWGLELAAQGYVVLAVDGYTTRTPVGATEAQYQNQCSNDAWKGDVDPYGERVDDIEAAQDYLVEEYDVDVDALGLLGWSQGAQSVMVAMAATPRATNGQTSFPASADALLWVEYPGVGHSFDHVGTTTFPTSKCNATALANAAKKAECAMRDADIDSLAFILAEI